MRPDIAPCSRFPDYELPDQQSVPRDLREVSRAIRADWDLGAPGLREAWDARDLSAFHGWNKWSPKRVTAGRSM